MDAIRAEEGSTETISRPKYTNLMASQDLPVEMDFALAESANIASMHNVASSLYSG